jgi:hypothetical protein
VTAVGAGALLLAAVSCGGNGDDGEGDARSGGDRGGEGAAPPSAGDGYQCPAVDTEVDGDSSIDVVDAGACTYSFGPTLDFARYALVVENTGTAPLADIEIRVEADTAAGRIDLFPMPDRIEVLPEGARIGIGHGLGLEEPAVVETLVVTVDASPLEAVDEMPPGEVVVSEASTTLDDDGRTNRITVSSSAADMLEDLPVYFVYRNEAGDIVGGASDSIDALVSPAPVELSFTEPYANPDVATVEAYVDAPVLPLGAGADGAT